jgi:hypothetical protein
MNRKHLAFAAAVLAGAIACHADTITLNPVKDNTLYQDAQGDVSNALGADIFAGMTDNGSIRRAALAFDFSAIPPGSTVTSASLGLKLNRARSGTYNMTTERSPAGARAPRGIPTAQGRARWPRSAMPRQHRGRLRGSRANDQHHTQVVCIGERHAPRLHPGDSPLRTGDHPRDSSSVEPGPAWGRAAAKATQTGAFLPLAN